MSTTLVNHATIDMLHEEVNFNPGIVVQEHVDEHGKPVKPTVGEVIASAIAQGGHEDESIHQNARRINEELAWLTAIGEVEKCNTVIWESVAAQGVLALFTEIPVGISEDSIPGPHINFAA